MTQHAATRNRKMIQFPLDQSQARDELNLCEFPLAVLSNRVPGDCLELSFTDKVWDESKQESVERNLVVSAPPKYGLPTAKDEEVLLALIHLTDQVNRFESPTVPLSQYSVVKLLGWNDGAKSYRRVRESLARWKSVTLDYRNAWRDHKSKSWVSEMFSIIDNVTIYDVDAVRRRGTDDDQLDLPLSSFTWNRVFFDSMQAKYFKRLDFGFYQRLKTPTAKRVFRFLDKRFGSGRDRWEFDLHEFAFEHIGLSRKYDTGKIKEKLNPAITELEAEGYLQSVDGDRFRKHGKKWRVVFTRARSSRALKLPPLAEELHRRGVSPAIAKEIVGAFDVDQIRKQIEFFDWILEHDADQFENPPGFLVASIRQDFAAPSGYQTKEDQEVAASQRASLEAKKARQLAEEEELQRQHAADRAHVTAARARLTDRELQELEQRVIAEADEADREVLASPALRQIQIDLLVDKYILEKVDVNKIKLTAINVRTGAGTATG